MGGGIAADCTKERVEAFFKKFGRLTAVTMPTRFDKKLGTRRHRGFAYLEWETARDAAKVVKKAHKQKSFAITGFRDFPVEVIPRLVVTRANKVTSGTKKKGTVAGESSPRGLYGQAKGILGF